VDLKISHEDGYVLARIAGPIDHSAREVFGKHLHPLVRRSGAKLVVDLSRSTFLSSSGLGELVALAACANMNASQVVLAACSPFVSIVLNRSRLDTFFAIAESVFEAAALLPDELQLVS
jgi:anti-sigma B factor antagonist